MSREVTIAGVSISRPEKEMYPATDEAVAVTKADVAGYYADLAEAMLPHLRGRPISMQRFPDGIEGSSFYEKKVPGHFPDFVTRVEVDTADGAKQQETIEDKRTLAYLDDQDCCHPLVLIDTLMIQHLPV